MKLFALHWLSSENWMESQMEEGGRRREVGGRCLKLLWINYVNCQIRKFFHSHSHSDSIYACSQILSRSSHSTRSLIQRGWITQSLCLKNSLRWLKELRNIFVRHCMVCRRRGITGFLDDDEEERAAAFQYARHKFRFLTFLSSWVHELS